MRLGGRLSGVDDGVAPSIVVTEPNWTDPCPMAICLTIG
jgi:hypothetical protein